MPGQGSGRADGVRQSTGASPGALSPDAQARFEIAKVGLLLADPESACLGANPTMCRMLGYEREELIGLHASDVVVRSVIPNIDAAIEEIGNPDTFVAEVARFLPQDS